MDKGPVTVFQCHTITNCTQTCLKSVNHALAIAEIKKMRAAEAEGKAAS